VYHHAWACKSVKIKKTKEIKYINCILIGNPWLPHPIFTWICKNIHVKYPILHEITLAFLPDPTRNGFFITFDLLLTELISLI
jgi:hypothetical protein